MMKLLIDDLARFKVAFILNELYICFCKDSSHVHSRYFFKQKAKSVKLDLFGALGYKFYYIL